MMGEVRNPESPGRPAQSEARPAHLDASALLDQIEAGARSAARLSRVTVQLRPPELGTIQIAVESRQGNLSAHFHASHPVVMAWLESSAPTLRSQLVDSGLPFQNLSFSTTAHDHGGGWAGERQEAPQGGAALGLAAQASGERAEPLDRTRKSAVEWRA